MSWWDQNTFEKEFEFFNPVTSKVDEPGILLLTLIDTPWTRGLMLL
jgi:hypothetical protein